MDDRGDRGFPLSAYRSEETHKVKVKWSRCRPGVAQRMGRGIAPLFHDRGTRRGWVVSSTPRPHFIPGKDPVPILQEAWWAPGPVWTGGKYRPHRDSIPDRPAQWRNTYVWRYSGRETAVKGSSHGTCEPSVLWRTNCTTIRRYQMHPTRNCTNVSHTYEPPILNFDVSTLNWTQTWWLC